MAGAGDVNGDGRDDVIVGAYHADNNGRTASGSAYVIYGRAASPSAPIDLADTNGAAAGSGVDPADGFRIDGAAADDQRRLLGGRGGRRQRRRARRRHRRRPGADNNGRTASGSAYVVYGARHAGPDRPGRHQRRCDGSGVDPADGFRIDGAAAGDQAGNSVAGAGDVNGDGRDDVIVGAPSPTTTAADSGSAYVIYGRAASPSAPIDLADSTAPRRAAASTPPTAFASTAPPSTT